MRYIKYVVALVFVGVIAFVSGRFLNLFRNGGSIIVDRYDRVYNFNVLPLDATLEDNIDMLYGILSDLFEDRMDEIEIDTLNDMYYDG